MPGMGGEVRSYYFVKAAAEIGNVTLISLGGHGGRLEVQPDLAARCERVIEAKQFADTETTAKKPKGRVANWVKTLGVMSMPWRNSWSDFLVYHLQHCSPVAKAGLNKPRLSKRLLSTILDYEFWGLASLFDLPPLTAVMMRGISDRMQIAVQKVTESESFDIVWIENTLSFPFAVQWLGEARLREANVLLSGHNVETTVLMRNADVAETPRERNYWHLNAKIMKRLEKKAFRIADLTVHCSNEDCRRADELQSTGKYVAVGNGVNSTYFTSESIQPSVGTPTIV